MRKRAALLAAPLTWVACFSSNGGSSDAGTSFDASTDTSFPDVAQNEAAAEAGEPDASADVQTPVEASPPVDAPVDVAPDGPPMPVTVTVIGPFGPEDGVPIVSESATGAYLDEWTTANGGKVQQMLPVGSMVTVLLGTPANAQPLTIVGVQPGDALTIVDPTTLANVSATITAVPAAPPVGTQYYEADIGACIVDFDSPPSEPDVLTSNCIGEIPSGTSFASAVPVLLLASSNTSPPAFAFQKGIPLSTASDAGSLGVALGGAWSTSLTQQSVDVANPPPEMPTVAVSEIASGVLFPIEGQYAPADAGGLLLFTTHVGFADTVQVEVDSFSSSGQGAVVVASSLAPPTANGALAIDATSLGSFPTISATQASAGTGGLPLIAWSADTLNTVTGVIAFTSWSATTADGGFQSGTWTIVSPATAETSLQAPALGPMTAAFAPVAGSSFENPALIALQGAALPSYGSVRQAASLFRTPGGCLSAPLVPPLASGSLTMSFYSAGGCG